MKCLRRVTACLLAMLLITVGLPPAGQPAFAVSENREAVTLGRGGGLYEYLIIHADKPDAVSPIILDARELDDDCYVEWDFIVETAGMYELDFTYYALPGLGRDLEFSFLLNGETPYLEAGMAILKRSWRDVLPDGEFPQDSRGNDLIPRQEEVYRRSRARLTEVSGFINRPHVIWLPAGEHTLRLQSVRGAFKINELILSPPVVLPSYAEVEAEYIRRGYTNADKKIMEMVPARTPVLKSDQSILPVSDRSSPATVPYHVSLIRRNTIGQHTWANAGMWIMYEFTAPQTGLYTLCLKYRQNLQPGRPSYRSIYINGAIPFKEFEHIAFAYDTNWNNFISPYRLYFEEGETVEVKIEVTLGDASYVFVDIDNLNYRINNLYREIIMAIGGNPDPWRDYRLETQIPGLRDRLRDISDGIYAAIDEITALSGGVVTETESVRRAAQQLANFAARPDTIATRLPTLRENIAAVSHWLLDAIRQPLELNYLLLMSPEADPPKPRATFWQSVRHFFLSFWASFFEDYDSIGEQVEGAIDVWVSMGRDQTQIIKDLTEAYFTPETGIRVNFSLVQGGLIEATLAGVAPDVSIGAMRAQPVNLACRGALYDLSRFPDFEEVAARFPQTAMVPYEYLGGTYALPMTQLFFMMFYRTDIFEELGLEPPNTWEEFDETLKVILRHNMRVGLPYTPITLADAFHNGMGMKDLYSVLLLQNGGSFYTDDLRQSALDSPQALDAFITWCEYYTKYESLLDFNFNTRFRSGEMPLGISGFTSYVVFSFAAPEIRGLWEMAPIPGTMRDGASDRTLGANGQASMILAGTKDPEACWEFLKWWMEEETQFLFGQSLENIMGVGGRFPTANLAAFDRLNWTRQELELITYQRSYVREIPEVPGGYFVSQSIDNAFRSVLYSYRNPRERFEWENRNINIELERKWDEFLRRR
jgi:ABC-type glycerol-3-phosphate transport system substrate-binding protein